MAFAEYRLRQKSVCSLRKVSLCTLSALGLMVLPACVPTNEEAVAPLNVEQFKPGADRLSVMQVVGQPESTTRQAGRQCDTYQVYTKGLRAETPSALAGAAPSAGQKQQGQMDIQPTLHKLVFCYAANGVLSDIYDQNPTTSLQPVHRVFSVPYQQSSQAVTLTVAQAHPVKTQIDHVQRDPATGQIIIYQKAALPKPSAQAGSITLNTVSQEATNGRQQVETGQVQVSTRATADDLNAVSQQKAQAANQATFAQAAQAPWRTPANTALGAGAE
ncbi:MAG: hypothetical protein L0I33_08415 [Acetobacter sp.]|nr:hypothetical protein [Acetobacter sp.]